MSDASTPFNLKATGAAITVEIGGEGSNLPSFTLQISSNGSTWSTWNRTQTPKLTIQPNEKIYFRATSSGNMNGFGKSESDYQFFVIDAAVEEEYVYSGEYTALCEASGNLMSLLSQSFYSMQTIPSDYCFAKLFQGCDRLTSSPLLPAATLKEGCYHSMFSGCTHLTSVQSFAHVTSLEAYCFTNMFSDCTEIAGSVALPGTSQNPLLLKDNCYEGMFANCHGITSVSGLKFQGKMAPRCFDSMFFGCNGLDDNLFDADHTGFSLASVTELAESCFSYMFSECTGITRIPAMPSGIAMKDGCYEGMFAFCTGITHAQFALPSVMAFGCCRDMFYGCSSLLSDNSHMSSSLFSSVTTLDVECFQNMFSECVSMENAPALPGTFYRRVTLAEGCYSYMFCNCTNLDSLNGFYVPSVMVEGCFSGMFYGCEKLTNTGLSNGGFSLGSVSSLADGCFSEMFYGCENIASLPSLPSRSSVLFPRCYDSMFRGCSSISSISGFELPSTMQEQCCRAMFRECSALSTIGNGVFQYVSILAKECFKEMFYGCEKITTSPSIAQSSFKESCCAYMYYGCTRLSSASSIQATSLDKKCCMYMFAGCTSLQTAPSLPGSGVALAESCYAYMFSGCELLQTPPSLPATSLAVGCYQNMFYGCVLLEAAPDLPATSLDQVCYRSMFSGCSSLKTIGTIGAFSQNANGVVGYGSCYGMFYNCESVENAPAIHASMRAVVATPSGSGWWDSSYSGTWSFSIPPSTGFHYGIVCGPVDETHKDCYLIRAPDSEHEGAFSYYDLYYYKQNGWLYATKKNVSTSESSIQFQEESCFAYMFYGCKSLKASPYLGALSLNPYCYSYMFCGCTSLVDVGTIEGLFNANGSTADYCCHRMFQECEKLYTFNQSLSIPAIRAGVLRQNSLSYMFYKCLALDASPYLQDGTVTEESCCLSMFEGCISIDVIVFPSCYTAKSSFSRMYYGCTGLRDILTPFQVPKHLSESCFESMFQGCTSLVDICYINSTSLSPRCCASMFYGCSSIVEPMDTLPAMNLASGCYFYMFYGCSSLKETPRLPASDLADSCYYGMFYGCSSLKIVQKIDALHSVSASLARNCCALMFKGCSSLTSIHELKPTALSDSCYYGMFSECSGIDNLSVSMLPALSAVYCCYYSMFSECSSLEHFVLQPESWSFSVQPPSGYSYGIIRHPYTSYYTFNLVKVPDGYTGGLTFYDYPYFNENNLVLDTVSESESAQVLSFEIRKTVTATRSTYIGVYDYWSYSTPAPEGYSYVVDNDDPDYSGNIRCRLIKVNNENGSAQVVGTGTGYRQPNQYYTDEKYRKISFNVSGTTVVATNTYFTWYQRNDWSFEPAAESGFRYLISKTEYSSISGYYQMHLLKINTSNYAVSFVGTSLAYGTYTYANFWYDEPAIATLSTPAAKTDKMNLPATTLAQSCYEYMFSSSGIKAVPNLPVTNLSGANNCYSYMFKGCDGLAPSEDVDPSISLPATTLSPYCYRGMFQNCTGLRKIPSLPVTNLSSAEYCYSEMFRGCTGLLYQKFNDAYPHWSLPATSLSNHCYSNMFYGCTGLTDIPRLIAQNIGSAEYCYSDMFYGCTGIVSITDTQSNRAIRASTLSKGCFDSMFQGCSSLEKTPYLISSSVPDKAYYCMFSGCTSLNDATPASLSGVTSIGKYACEMMYASCTSLVNPPSLPSSDFRLSDYCYSNMFFRSGISSTPYLRSSLLAVGCYERMFYGCNSLVSASAASMSSVTEVAESCCEYMFSRCEYLETPPSFPGQSVPLEYRCYYQMFTGCISLQSAPALPAMILDDSCYEGMFQNCYGYRSGSYVGLSAAPALPASALKPGCYRDMFSGCQNLSDVSQISFEQVSTLDYECCCGMFSSCSRLTNPPQMPGSSVALAEGCYEGMFMNSGISNPPALAGTSLAENCYKYMFNSCSSMTIGNSYTLPATVMKDSCYYGMFSGCSNNLFTTASSILPVENGVSKISKLANECFAHMFQSCTKLSTPPTIPSSVPLKEGCFSYMFSSTALASPVELPATVLANECYKGMFSYCGSMSIGNSYTLPATVMKDSCYCEMFSYCYGNGFTNASSILPVSSGSSAIEVAEKDCFKKMFYGCSKLVTPPSMVPSVLRSGCFREMFYGCTNMTSIPSFGPTVIESYSLYQMFYNCQKIASTSGIDMSGVLMIRDHGCYQTFGSCTSLTNASSIDLSSVKRMYENGCEGMFVGCIKLGDGGQASDLNPKLPRASFVPDNCYQSMFYNCHSLKSAPSVSSSKFGKNSCFQMFYGCNSIQTAEGVLPVGDNDASEISSLSAYCFASMFQGCSSIANPAILPDSNTKLAEHCYDSMFRGCSSLSRTPELKAPSLEKYCYYMMFSGCTSLSGSDASNCPFVMATKSAYGAMAYMFNGCSSLRAIKISFSSDPSETDAYLGWANSTSANGTLYVPTGSSVAAMIPYSGTAYAWTKSEYS